MVFPDRDRTWEEISREKVDPRDVADQAEDDAEE